MKQTVLAKLQSQLSGFGGLSQWVDPIYTVPQIESELDLLAMEVDQLRAEIAAMNQEQGAVISTQGEIGVGGGLLPSLFLIGIAFWLFSGGRGRRRY